MNPLFQKLAPTWSNSNETTHDEDGASAFFGYLVVLCSSLTGFLLAVGRHATWQAPIENAQVLAGLVHYPDNNPYYMYLIKLWSLVNQASALMLWSGMSEISASILVCGIIGGISFAAITLVVLAIGNSAPMALLAPLIIYQFNLVGEGVAYPIWLMGTTHSFGILGLSWTLLIIGLLGCRYSRTGLLALGLAPAVHPSLGIFSMLLITATLVANRRTLGTIASRGNYFFLAGLLLSIASFAWQMRYAAGLPELPLAEKQLYLEAFMAHFDYHRQTANPLSDGVFIACCTLLVGSTIMLNRAAPIGAKFVAFACSMSVIIAGGLILLERLLPHPEFIKVFMPWRYLNVANLAFTPLVLGLFAAKFVRNQLIVQFAKVLFAGVLAYLTFWQGFPPLYLYLPVTLLLLGAALPLHHTLQNRLLSVNGTLARWLWGIAIIAICFWTVVPATVAFTRGDSSSALFFPDRSNNSLLRVVSERPGMLLTAAADLHLLPLATRRPVLLDGGALDFFNYVPEAGPELNNILRKVYGLDIFVTPPPGQLNAGVITDDHRPLWEERSVDDWRTIRLEFGVTDILAPSDWNLQLPKVCEADGLSLFTIP